MALVPYLLEELLPRRTQDSLYGLDLLEDLVDRPIVSARKYLRPWRSLAAATRDVGSTIKYDKDKFQLHLDVQHFDPEEITVKTSDGYIIVEGKHEERKDAHGYVSRQFKRRYALPEGCSPEMVESKLSSDGVLTVTAPRVSDSDERVIPITHTGPVRRKPCDNQDDQINGDVEPEAKVPEKKRKKTA